MVIFGASTPVIGALAMNPVATAPVASRY